MKAKELAEELLKHPDFDVELAVNEPVGFLICGLYVSRPDIRTYGVTGIADIGHSDKVIVLDGEVEENG